jgi:CRISPR system Cascade subunit CasA
MWRDLAALLPQVAGDDKTTRPGVLDWLGLLDIKGKIDVCAVGYEYGAMQADINEMIADAVTLNARLLTDLGNEWIVNILQVLDDTEKAVDALGRLASDLGKAAGGDGTRAGEGPKDRAYFALDEPFRAWLAEIAPAGDRVLETCNRWKGVANRILSEIGRELTRNAGNAAFVGRPVKESKKPYYMSSAIADMKFEAALKRILGGDAKSG